MTLLEHIEGLSHLRDKAWRDAARLTIELQACDDVIKKTTSDFSHVEERRIYTQAYNLALDVLKQGDA